MGRPWREEYKGGIYHVIARGNNKEYIFKESIDKGYLIKQLKECSAAMGCRVYGYVLMDNHYHLIVQTLDKKLQEIMHQINNKYSKYELEAEDYRSLGAIGEEAYQIMCLSRREKNIRTSAKHNG
jgi:REP element-mobilizing transposase RayT